MSDERARESESKREVVATQNAEEENVIFFSFERQDDNRTIKPDAELYSSFHNNDSIQRHPKR